MHQRQSAHQDIGNKHAMEFATLEKLCQLDPVRDVVEAGRLILGMLP